MKPDDENTNNSTSDSLDSSRQAAANIIKNQIDELYDNDSGDARNNDPNPYDWSHTKHVNPQAEQWKKYHSAWQEYYQKYYEGYYTHQMAKKQQTKEGYFTNPEPSSDQKSAEAVTSEQAIADLRHKLLKTVSESAQKVRKSRHFKPLLAGIIVVLISLFIQYNGFIFGNIIAYVSPGSIDIQNIVIDPNAQLTVDPAPRLIIPKINVDVPVIYDIGNDYDSLKVAMRQGVAHFAIPGASSHPGELGNTVLSGHSSNDLFATGDYKFIFAQLEKLTIGDSVYINYQSKRYTYTITGTKIVGPSDVNALVLPASKPILTLLTCTPVGTATNRLLVFADQVSPDPTKSITAPNAGTPADPTELMPGNQPTLIEWLLGQFSGRR